MGEGDVEFGAHVASHIAARRREGIQSVSREWKLRGTARERSRSEDRGEAPLPLGKSSERVSYGHGTHGTQQTIHIVRSFLSSAFEQSMRKVQNRISIDAMYA